MAFVLGPENLGKKDVPLIGGKGANLAELISAGFPVPEPFFITSEAYQEFLKSNDLRSEIMDTPFVAVRSSGIMEDIEKASSAGQYETFLNIKGEKKLIEAVKRCWASLYTPRVMYYRNK